MQEPTKQFIKKYKSFSHGKVEIVLNAMPNYIDIEGIGFQYDSLITINDIRKDSISLWFENIRELDDPELIIRDGEWADTLGLGSFDESDKMEIPEFEIVGKTIIKQSPKKPLEFLFSLPLSVFDKSNMAFRTDTIKLDFNPSLSKPMTLDFSTEWGEIRNANLYLFPNAVKDIYGQTNDTTLIRMNILGIEDHSELILSLNCERQGNYIIEMFEGERIEKVETFSDSTLFSWKWLSPGEYQIRVIEDLNQNGIWDTGNYFENVQPEPVALFGTTLQLRANWLLEQNWDLKFE